MVGSVCSVVFRSRLNLHEAHKCWLHGVKDRLEVWPGADLEDDEPYDENRPAV
jgi:hypothetical protein